MFYFYTFYKDAIIYIDHGGSYINQLLFIITYYLPNVSLALIYIYILFTAQLYLIMAVFMKKKALFKTEINIHVYLSIITLVITTYLFLSTLLWLPILIVIIFSFTSAYITYVIVNEFNSIERYIEKNNGVVQVTSSFSTKEEALDYFDKFKESLEFYNIHNGENYFLIYTLEEIDNNQKLLITITTVKPDEVNN